MKYHELNISRHDKSKRLGRGIASGKGKTAGRGTKGQGARTGSAMRPGFTGGQNPLMQQLPKLPGFKNKNPKAENVYTNQLNAFGGKVVDNSVLHEQGLISSPYVKVKLISGKETVSKKATVKVQAASASAIAALEAAGGSFEAIDVPKRPARKTEKK